MSAYVKLTTQALLMEAEVDRLIDLARMRKKRRPDFSDVIGGSSSTAPTVGGGDGQPWNWLFFWLNNGVLASPGGSAGQGAG